MKVEPPRRAGARRGHVPAPFCSIAIIVGGVAARRGYKGTIPAPGAKRASPPYSGKRARRAFYCLASKIFPLSRYPGPSDIVTVARGHPRRGAAARRAG